MTPRSHILLIGAGLLSLSAVAIAQPPGPPPPGGPGMHQPVNRAELKTKLEARFDAMDANHDGTVTPDERKAKRTADRAKMRDAMFAKLDTDKNGSISKAEFDSPQHRMMHRPDADADRAKTGGSKWHHRRGHGHGHGMKHGQFGGFQNKSMTKAEFVNAGLAMFDRVDTNHDGTISAAERDAAHKAIRNHAAGKMPPPPPPGQ